MKEKVGCNESPTRLENWEAKLGQLTARAWQKGLWHSESELSKSLKSFISTLLQEERDSLKAEVFRVLDAHKNKWIDENNDGNPKALAVIGTIMQIKIDLNE